MPPGWSLKKCCIFFVFTFISRLAIYPLGVKDQRISSYFYLRSICQYFKATFDMPIFEHMARRLSRQTSIFGVVFFVSRPLLGIEGEKKLKKICNFLLKAPKPC